ncbi:molybdate ABC transporter substrate-binding protein [Cellulomonas sp. WB94]|uniref:molybdate ABC transporter substrate-binding protein n=1 Tax=Cellulomonas sp. WB94 TaxID=2173174 RepID=UPI000D5632F9|nr:molybdate ABC transporter substrate-binding protein [Cellulomonas sp. WB94]PVU83466.1 molybdate ABC transporter substrate-binding protein [Cellulomonas sp. WB94]
MRRPLLATLTAVAAAIALLAGCGSSAGSDAGAPAGSASASGTPPTFAGKITVFAAASLTGSFTTLGKQFEAAHTDATITFSFGPSSGLATQITEGAPADVFASASAKNMDAVVAAQAAEAPSTFAENVMEIAVAPGNPARIATLADLAQADVKVALCQPDVPCGTVAAKVLAAAGLTVTPVTLEADVKATLTKIELGEVDAGLVYVTDVLAAGDRVMGIEIPADVNAATSYPIATLAASTSPELAKAFVDYVLSADGARVLAAAGFQTP